jgi:3-carboxy-cis,cis-muconate cycloisomerase
MPTDGVAAVPRTESQRRGQRHAFSLLEHLYSDPEMCEIFSEERTVEYWLRVERALALAQAEVGILTKDEASSVAAACALVNVDLDALWESSRNVGYPILPLIRLIARSVPQGPDGRIHYGATTQDIMDTALVLQLLDAAHRLQQLIQAFGDAIAELAERHTQTVMAARTHAQQAVPTTFGAKLAVLLDELRRMRERLTSSTALVGAISLYGAGGTSAAIGPRASELRRVMAASLGLTETLIPWHVARERIVEFGLTCAFLASVAGRFAREVIDLSRTEIGEVREADGHHRGASSTMPQKANPIAAEAIVGVAATAQSLASALLRALEAGHERAAGEWQIEWLVLPQLVTFAATSLALAGRIAAGLQVFPEAMRRNLAHDDGLLMAEAQMMRLAPAIGRERAHDLVYRAVTEARRTALPLTQTLARLAAREGIELAAATADTAPESYLGEAQAICAASVASWRAAHSAGEA